MIVISGKKIVEVYLFFKKNSCGILIADSSGFLNLFKLDAILAVVIHKCISFFMVIRMV